MKASRVSVALSATASSRDEKPVAHSRAISMAGAASVPVVYSSPVLTNSSRIGVQRIVRSTRNR